MKPRLRIGLSKTTSSTTAATTTITTANRSYLREPKKNSKALSQFVPPNFINDLPSEKCGAVKTADDLKTDIAQMEAHLEKQALRQLQDEIKPQQDTEQILKDLNIPTEISGDLDMMEENYSPLNYTSSSGTDSDCLSLFIKLYVTYSNYSNCR